MSKELEAFVRLEQNSKRYKGRKEDLDIIFTALKDYERRLALAKEYEDVNNVGKRLKALKIIKEKERDIGLNFGSVIGNEPKQYTITLYDITQEEYDLLKEVLL